jgi:hypothetical protein
MPAQGYTYSPLSQLTGTGTGTGTASYGYDNAADPTTLGNASQTLTAGGQLASAMSRAPVRLRSAIASRTSCAGSRPASSAVWRCGSSP